MPARKHVGMDGQERQRDEMNSPTLKTCVHGRQQRPRKLRQALRMHFTASCIRVNNLIVLLSISLYLAGGSNCVAKFSAIFFLPTYVQSV